MHQKPLNVLYILSSFLLATTESTAEKQTVFCEFCCPHLFSSSIGVINVRDSSSLLHSISYIIRCLMSTDEVVIVSDGASSHPTWLNWNRYKNDESRKLVCTLAENVLLSYLRATDFLQSDLGYFQKLVPTYSPAYATSFTAMMAKRTNFIFISDSQEQMTSLISKVEKELQYLRIGRKFFWQPYIIFLWSEVQHHFKNVESDVTANEGEPEENILHSWFENYQPYFTLDSGVFMFFIVQKGNSTRSQMNLYLSVWECYKLKGKFILQEVTRQPYTGFKKKGNRYEEKCNSTVRSASPMLSWMEKVNSYVFIERFLRRDDFRLMPVTASIVPSDSTDWIVITHNENGAVRLERGSSVDIYKNLQMMMNFSDNVLIGDGVQFLWTINDTLSQLENADILLNQKSITPGRGQIYSFLQPTYYGIYEAFFRQPSANNIRNIVSAPFTISLWAITITTWVLIVGCLYCCGYVAKRNSLLCVHNDSEFIGQIGLWAIAAISQKSWYMSPSSTNFKTFYYIGSIMALICYVAYSAMIVSFLTVKTVPIKTLDNLIQYNYKFTVHESSEATVSLLQEMIITFGLHQNVIKINTENEITHLEGRTKALLSYPDLFYKTADAQNYTENFICSNIDSLPVGNTPYKSSMSVKKASQFREIFSAKLLVVLERGLNFRYKKMYDDNKNINCPRKENDQGERRTVLDPVRITDVFTAFLVIFIGWLVAVSMFFTERLYKRRRNLYTIMFLVN